jgi:hypothetical protein
MGNTKLFKMPVMVPNEYGAQRPGLKDQTTAFKNKIQ